MLLKSLFTNIILLFFFLNCSGQYYLRGEIKDEKNEYLQNVKILLHSDKLLYYSGTTGGFGISSVSHFDSLTLSLDGYESKSVRISSDALLEITMKPLSSNASKNRPKLISITKDQSLSSKYTWFVSDESYFSLVENEVVNTQKFPNTGFSLNVNKASYSNIRRFLNMQSVVPPDAVRLEELLNYFNLNYKEPERNEFFKIESQLSDCPWSKEKRLLYLNVNARKLDMNNVPPSNLVFLIDASGSMDLPNRLPLVKAAFQMLVKNLRPIDTVSIVIYGGTVAVWMQPTSGAEKQKIIQSIEELTASGDTPGESAIRLAYTVAKRSFIQNGNNRVILATDGDFNVGETSEKALEDLITRERQSGVYLTCLGVGMGNYKDSKLETLAKKGNGNFAYIDNLQEAQKILVTEFTQTLYSVANNTYLKVNFEPNTIKEYRLIGFDNKKNAAEDSTSELEGGEVGSGHSLMAIFEIRTLIHDSANYHGPLASLSLQYKSPESDSTHKQYFTVLYDPVSIETADSAYRFAAAIALFGSVLKQSRFTKHFLLEDIYALAKTAVTPTDARQTEFLALIEKAVKVYKPVKRKK